MNKYLVKLVNFFHPGYSSCYHCGRNWGWTKYEVRPTTGGGLFLFCVDCDKVVTPEERWKALDAWKAECRRQLVGHYSLDTLWEAEKIDLTELSEFPRR